MSLKFIAQLTLVSAALLVSANTIAPCPTTPVIISNETVTINGQDIVFTKSHCESRVTPRSNSRILPRSTLGAASTVDFCGTACTAQCPTLLHSNVPITASDCTILADAIAFRNSTWTVDSGDEMVAVFNTCGANFVNFDQVNILEYCDASWASNIVAINAACITPSNPIQTGFCQVLATPLTVEWEIDVAQAMAV
ncbi:hypothetical protein BDP27DRAFT_1449387 [Rhodocollybia butyracea]|uniref:Uncharacterized protein n=1 Tax=Rhodocollybia butyracea TaxID=206335 RepID=A0A9P5PN42_9AGAR|nr:hypothetical protein BDP27DRAFT_1449387 [Rhodocollybia butyracea]